MLPAAATAPRARPQRARRRERAQPVKRTRAGGAGLTRAGRRAQVATNPVGLMVALLAVCCTAVYQIWAGSKQKELGAGSMQLMHQFAPHATGLLAALVLGVEPLGLPGPAGGGCAHACADGPSMWQQAASLLGAQQGAARAARL